jgi:hypothetical protein
MLPPIKTENRCTALERLKFEDEGAETSLASVAKRYSPLASKANASIVYVHCGQVHEQISWLEAGNQT